MQSVAQKLIATLRKPARVDPVRLQMESERGARADALLRDEAFNEALDEIRAVYMSAWRNSDALDVEARERCHVAVCLLDDIKAQLVSTVRNGTAAREKISQIQS